MWRTFASSFSPLLLFWYYFFPLWLKGIYVVVVIWVYLFITHGCKPLSQQNAADSWERIPFESLQLLFLHVPVCFNLYLLSCVASCSSAFGPAAAALQLLASFQRMGGLTHYVKSFCPWGSQHRVMERWLSPVCVLALTDGYLSVLPLWRPKACVWCWVKHTAAQTKSRPLDFPSPSHHVYLLQKVWAELFVFNSIFKTISTSNCKIYMFPHLKCVLANIDGVLCLKLYSNLVVL